MKNLFLRRCLLCVLFLSLSGCASDEMEEWGTKKVEVEEVPFTKNPEKVDGKIDVYNSMARTVKYNVEFVSQNIKKKVNEPLTSNMTARQLINSMVDVKTADENPLYNAIRVLDFSVIFAVNNLESNDALKNEHLYAKSAQFLALGAIKSHQSALFSLKKLSELDRMMRKQQKVAYDLSSKMDKNGTLSDEEIEYKKGIDVALFEMAKIKQALQENVAQYEQLIKFQDKKLALEGRRFYELDDFDRNFVLTTFQRTAVENRTEFKKGIIAQNHYAFDDIQNDIFKDYPEIEQLQINGFGAKDNIYVEGLIKRANLTAEKLVAASLNYSRINAAKNEEKAAAKTALLRELGIAVFEQVEIAYNMVKSATTDYDMNAAKIKELKDDLRSREKNYQSSMPDKLEVLNLKLGLMEAESKQSLILAERAVALRSLYFYAGFSPFNQSLMEKEVKDIAISLRVAFNQDLVKMLSSSPKSERKASPVDEDWSKKDNWLENVVEGSGASVPAVSRPQAMSEALNQQVTKQATGSKSVPVVPNNSGYYASYGADYDSKKVMQLGSFTHCSSADAEWRNLQSAYPELKAFQPKTEEIEVDGQKFFRLTVQSDKGGFVKLCNKLRQNQRGCILR